MISTNAIAPSVCWRATPMTAPTAASCTTARRAAVTIPLSCRVPAYRDAATPITISSGRTTTAARPRPVSRDIRPFQHAPRRPGCADSPLLEVGLVVRVLAAGSALHLRRLVRAQFDPPDLARDRL